MGRQHDGDIRMSKEVKDFVKQFMVEGNDVYTKGATYFDFDKFIEETSKLLKANSGEYIEQGWHGLEEASYWEKNEIGYLSFSFYGTFTSFPEGIAIILTLLFPNQEIGVYENVEDWGSYLDVYKNGERVFCDSCEDDYGSQEEPEEKEVKENPTSISFDNFFQREEPKELTPEEKAEQEKYWKEREQYWQDVHWFNEHENSLPKNSDGTFVITEDMPLGAKEKAEERNKIIVAKAQEPSHEEVVKELGKTSLSFEEMSKAITWLEHHDCLCDGWETIVTKDMPILVKAHILFRRKHDEELDKEWEKMFPEGQDESESDIYDTYEDDE